MFSFRERGRTNSLRSSIRIAIGLAVLVIAGTSSSVVGQVVQVKTVPVATGDQFLLFPSSNLAMGSVSLALPDTLGDPFSNPATGSRIQESFFFGTPTIYSISNENGSGRSLPLGAIFSSDRWFGGGTVSIQEIENARWSDQVLPNWSWFPQPPDLLSENSSRNLYAFGIVGHRFPDLGLSLGLSGFRADLDALDGVDLLYAQSQAIEQSGHFSDLRLGILKEWDGDRSLEVILFQSKLRMTHEVTYLDLIWEDVPPDVNPNAFWEPRVEENLDHTDTRGAHLAYRWPLGTRGWRMGWSVTGNWKDHPKIPNYEIQNIPRDPGNTQAYSVGMGVSKVEGPSRFAVDLLLQPIRSETWADAAADTVSASGIKVHAGDKTVENDFHFANALVRAGGSWDYRQATFRGGIQVRSISYELDQYDHVDEEKRDQTESWMEWSPSLGVSLNLEGATIHLATRFTTGTGRPGTQWDLTSGAMMDSQSTDFILAPSGPLTLQDARVTTHQLSVVIPIR